MADDGYDGFDTGRPVSLAHPDAPKFPKVIPPSCRDGFLFMIKNWVIQEQITRIRRYGADEQLYNHQIGYMLCLSNLMELLMEVEHTIQCSHQPPKTDD